MARIQLNIELKLTVYGTYTTQHELKLTVYVTYTTQH